MRKMIIIVAVLLLAMAAKGESKMPMLKWAGKEKVVNHHNDVPFRVLERKWGWGKCCQCENIASTNANSQLGNGNTFTISQSRDENMIIHGDNLAALKALLPQYEGRVKCIYIDPPYNTGNEDWVYNDNVNDPQIKKWLGEVVGKEGEDFSRHDKWLCMMYPRLRLLQKLLSNDGYIFISINFTHEEAHLRLICDEIFGTQNFVGELTWESTTQPANAGIAKFGLQQKVEPILCYIKNKRFYKGFYLTKKINKKKYPHIGKFGPCRFAVIEKSDAGGYRRDTMKFKILGQFPRNGKRWQIGEDLARELEKAGKVEIVDGIVKRAVYPEDEEGKDSYTPFWSHFGAKEYGTAESGKAELNEIMGRATGFDTVKPVELIEAILTHVCDKDSVVLDSFAGSGTSAHAVLKMNKEDGGNRKFILVELMDYAETVTAERVKRVISGYGEGDKAVEGMGGGFGYYELGEPLMIGENLNEDLPLETIREYVWYMETRGVGNVADVGMSPIANSNVANGADPYLLGVSDETAYYFCYEKSKAVKLNRALLRKLKTKAERYVIYADICLLDDFELEKYNITFKKIPRDITRL